MRLLLRIIQCMALLILVGVYTSLICWGIYELYVEAGFLLTVAFFSVIAVFCTGFLSFFVEHS